MITLSYTEHDEDLKFILHCLDQTATLVKSPTLSLSDGTTDLDAIIAHLFTLAGEPTDPKSIAAFKRIRKAPTVPKPEFTVLNLLCYILTVRNLLATGSLKDKDPVDAFTKLLTDRGVKFDPDFALMEIRAGLITEIHEAPGLDKLYAERVEADRPYFICSGLREVYEKSDLLNNTFLFLLNLKKAKFKDLESEGMICCVRGETVDSEGESRGERETATVREPEIVTERERDTATVKHPETVTVKHPDTATGRHPETTTVEALRVEAKAGTRLKLEGHFETEGVTNGKIDIKKETFKRILSEFKVINHQLCFKGVKVTMGDGLVKTKTGAGPMS